MQIHDRLSPPNLGVSVSAPSAFLDGGAKALARVRTSADDSTLGAGKRSKNEFFELGRVRRFPVRRAVPDSSREGTFLLAVERQRCVAGSFPIEERDVTDGPAILRGPQFQPRRAAAVISAASFG